MPVSLTKYLSYTIVLLTTFIAHSSDIESKCPDMFIDSKDFREMVGETTLQQRNMESQILNESVNKKAIIDTFLTVHFVSHPQLKTSQTIKFVKLYINQPAFRKWVHEVQIFNSLKEDSRVSQTGLSELEKNLKEEAQAFSLTYFFDTYDQDSSFRKLADQLQSFILQIPHMKEYQNFQSFLISYEGDLFKTIQKQHQREFEVFMTEADQRTVAEGFIALQKKEKTEEDQERLWNEFFKTYTRDFAFRHWFKVVQIDRVLQFNKALLQQIPHGEILQLKQTLYIGIQDDRLKLRFLEAYSNSADLRDKMSEFMKFIFDYKIQ